MFSPFAIYPHAKFQMHEFWFNVCQKDFKMATITAMASIFVKSQHLMIPEIPFCSVIESMIHPHK